MLLCILYVSHSRKDDLNVSDDLTKKGTKFKSEHVLGTKECIEKLRGRKAKVQQRNKLHPGQLSFSKEKGRAALVRFEPTSCTHLSDRRVHVFGKDELKDVCSKSKQIFVKVK